MVYQLDPQGHQLKAFKYVDCAGETVRTLYANGAKLRQDWADPDLRAEIIQCFADRGINFDYLREVTAQPEADPFDLLCHLAFKTPVRSRRERADLLRQNRPDFFTQYSHRLNTRVTHPYYGKRLTYQQCFEVQARLLRKVIERELDKYPPFVVK